jgi:hypothetical protein
MLGPDQFRSGIAIVLVLREQLSGDDSELAGHRDDGHATAPTRPDTGVEAGERSRGTDGGMGSLGQQAPGVSLPRATDAITEGGSVARLADPGTSPR